MGKAIRFLAVAIVVIMMVFGVLYATNFPLTEIAGEKIGFADLINFLFFQAPPNLPEADVKTNPEISEWVSMISSADLGESAAMLSKIGNPIRFCVFRDYNYCQTFRIEGGKMKETTETPQKTVYVSYELALQIKAAVDAQNSGSLQSLLVKGVKSGEIKGLTVSDAMSIGN